ncbi:MAG: hypothetical protein KDK54_14115, partial [Leptospiraceae bacterium]|nr:hypothetical protein [Leptospiraceae bacterium]
ERLAKEKAEKERLEKERLAKLEAERLAKEKAEKERLEKERLAKLEAERLAKEKAEKERLEKERLAKLEAERLAKEKAEKERLAKEKAEKERLAKLEAERLAKEKAERERLEKERLAKLEAERLEKERLAKLEAERLARENAQKNKKFRIIDGIKNQTNSDYLSVSSEELDSVVKEFTTSCKSTDLPDILVLECYSDHIVLNLQNPARVDLFNYIRLMNDNLQTRLKSYLYFSEEASPKMRAALEKIMSNKDNRVLEWEEKMNLEKAIRKQNSPKN